MLDDGRLFLSRIGVNSVYSTVQVSDTNFHHVAVTKNGGKVTFYLDGGAYPAPFFGATFNSARTQLSVSGPTLGKTAFGELSMNWPFTIIRSPSPNCRPFTKPTLKASATSGCRQRHIASCEENIGCGCERLIHRGSDWDDSVRLPMAV